MNCNVDECGKPADYTFMWPWGTDGACCQSHVVVVQQKARAVRGPRTVVTFVPLNPDRPKEITRDERVALHAARLAAEGEAADSRKHAANLFNANTQLQKELKDSKLRCTEYEHQMRELRKQLEATTAELDAALISAGQAREELARHGIEPMGHRDRETPPDGWQPLPTPPEAPPPTRHVVEGSDDETQP